MANIIKLKLPPKGPRIEYAKSAKVIKIYGDDMFWAGKYNHFNDALVYLTSDSSKSDPIWR